MTFDYIIGSEESLKAGKALKHNYKKAGILFDTLVRLTFDMADTLDYDTRQKERRYFMHNITWGKDISCYLDIITDYIKEFATPEEIPALEKLALSMALFTNEDN